MDPNVQSGDAKTPDPTRVCVVLVTYNRAEALKATLESIQRQTWRDWELLVCDDASTDSTCLVVEDFMRGDGRIRYLGSGENLGMPENLNRGLLLARAPFIAIMHDGDVYHPTALEKWQSALLANPRASFAFNGYRVLDQDGSVIAEHMEGYPACMDGSLFLESVVFRRIMFGCPIHGTAMVRKEALDEVGYPEPQFREYADVDLWMRLCEGHQVAFVDEPLIDLARRDRHPEDWGRSRREARRIVRKIFRIARWRHYNGRIRGRGVEMVRHLVFSLAHECYYSAAEMKGRILRGR